jgi:hypothetical protein
MDALARVTALATPADPSFLIVDVLAPGPGEFGDQLLEFGIVGVELAKFVEHLLALVILADRSVG